MNQPLKSILGLFIASSLLNADAPMLQPVSFETVKPLIGKTPMMLEFGSTGCHSCQVMGRLLYQIKAKHPKGAIYFIDIYEDMDAAKAYGVVMIPTQVYLDESGKIIERHVGAIEEESLLQKLTALKILSER